jgi:hypothetical protein
MSENPARRWGREEWVVVQLLLLLALSGLLAMWPIRVTTLEVPYGDGVPQPSRYGYTASLVLFVLPLVRLSYWLYRQPGLEHQRKSAAWALLGILPLWCALDVLLGLTFFTFPNKDATIGWMVPGFSFERGWVKEIPVEEFVFYISGIALIQLVYVWASESWLARYVHSEKERRAHGDAPLIQIDGKILGFALLSVPLAFLYKKLGPHDVHDGIPGYFLFLLLAGLVPVVLYIRSVRPFVNWQAFSFANIALMLVYLIWEGTLAMPYGYWDYNRQQMLGVFVRPWGGLPIEAVALWFATGWLNLATYEALRIVFANGRPLTDLLRARRRS